MRVLHFFKTAFPDSMGGIEQIINQIAEGTTRLGVNNTVLSLSKVQNRQVDELNGYRSCRAPQDFEIASTGFSTSAISWFFKLSKEVDIIHYHFPWPFMDIAHFTARVKVPTVVTYHSDVVNQKKLLKLYQPLQYAFLNDVTRIIATSPNYKNSSPVLSRFSHKTETIPLGISPVLTSQDHIDKWARRFPFHFFLFVGVLRYYKGLNTLLDAARGAKYPIVIVGDGPECRALKEKAQNLNLGNVYFLGKVSQPDKGALLSLCYAMVFPSHLRSEAFGVSLLEAAQYSKPMITCEIGTGTSYVNIGMETGLVIEPESAFRLKEAMDFLWENPEESIRMGKNAAARYKNLFTSEGMVNSYFDLYSRLI